MICLHLLPPIKFQKPLGVNVLQYLKMFLHRIENILNPVFKHPQLIKLLIIKLSKITGKSSEISLEIVLGCILISSTNSCTSTIWCFQLQDDFQSVFSPPIVGIISGQHSKEKSMMMSYVQLNECHY